MSVEAELEKEGLKLLVELVKVPSTSPDGEHYWEAVEIIKEFLEKYSIETSVIRVPEEYQKKYCRAASDKPRYILTAKVGSGRPWIQLNGHYDVVPGGPGWSKTEPFKPLVEGSIVYGRGTTDMKGGLVAMALSLVKYSIKKEKPPGTLEAVFVPDEEIGGECGTGYYVHQLGQNLPDYVVIAEPSGPNNIWIGHKGGIWMKVIVKGRTAHASTPWMGDNAFIKASKLALWLEENYAKTLRSVKSEYTYDLPEGNTPTAMIGGEAGVPSGKANQVPGEAFFTIDRRLIVEERVIDVERELKETILEAASRLGIDRESIVLEVLTKTDPAFVPPGNPLSTALKKAAVLEGLPEPKEIVCIGGLDLRYYSVKGVTSVAYGPGEGNKAHAPDEYVDYKQILKFSDIYYRLPYELSVGKNE